MGRLDTVSQLRGVMAMAQIDLTPRAASLFILCLNKGSSIFIKNH